MLRTAALFAMTVGLTVTQSGNLRAQNKLPGVGEIPIFQVTAKTKQVYRFHFSGLQPRDAIQLAERFWPIVAKLPAENPLRKAVLQAKNVATFSDVYRSLRNSFLDAGIDTIYFVAEGDWIEMTTLPGYFIMPGTETTFKHLRGRLERTNDLDWVHFLTQFKPAPGEAGWMVCAQGLPQQTERPRAPRRVESKNELDEKKALVVHALTQSCPLRPASLTTGLLPAIHVDLNNTTPLTVINLERNKLDLLVSEILAALVPSAARTTDLLKEAKGITVSTSIDPFPFITQVAHMDNDDAARLLAREINKSIQGTVERVVDLDADIGPLLALFTQSTVLVSTRGQDVVLVMKPPILFDMGMAQRRAEEAQDQDWTAQLPPVGYHWELNGVLGTTCRYDMLARVVGVRVRDNGGQVINPLEQAVAGSTSFRIPLGGFTLGLTCDLQGNLKLEQADEGEKQKTVPAIELLDKSGGVVVILRLDLAPGSLRFDLARTKALIKAQMAKKIDLELEAKKELDGLENAQRLENLKKDATQPITMKQQIEFKEKSILLYNHRAAIALYQELDDEVAALQRRYHSATLVKDDNSDDATPNPFAAKRERFCFTGKWLYRFGMLTLYQDANGIVAGKFTQKGRWQPAAMVNKRDQNFETEIVSGRAVGRTLNFSSIDIANKEWAGKIVLDADGLSGDWTLSETKPPDIENKNYLLGPQLNIGQSPQMKKKQAQQEKKKQIPQEGKKQAQQQKGPELQGRLYRIDIGIPEAEWFQEVATGKFNGYWVHATDKRHNTLLDVTRPGTICDGKNQSGNVKCAVVGNIMFSIQYASSLIRTAILSPDGQHLTFDPITQNQPRIGFFPNMNPMQQPIELTRDDKP